MEPLLQKKALTPLAQTEVQAGLYELLPHWPLNFAGELEPCTRGVDNYNYFVDAAEGRHVISRLRTLSAEALHHVVALIRRLEEAGLPVPHIVCTRDGRDWLMPDSAPVVVQTCLDGDMVLHAEANHCLVAGEMLARFHLAGGDGRAFGSEHWQAHCGRLAGQYGAQLSKDERTVLEEELPALFTRRDGLANGVIHGDFFRDNLLFSGSECTGILDFYCCEMGEYARDIAIALVDWAWLAGEQRYCKERANALLAGYAGRRTLAPEELAVIPHLMRSAVTALWLYRLERQAGGARLPADRKPADMVRRLTALRRQWPLELAV